MNTLIKTLDSTKIKVGLFGVLLAILVIVPAFVHIQWLTGPMVNAVLIITAVLIGPMEAVMLGLMPSTVALSTGLLPIALAPMVPFIMLSNAILVAVFHYSRKKNYFLAVGVAAFLKFVFLHQAVSLIMTKFLPDKLTSKLAIMMSWPQFFTAVIGGIIAYALLKGLKKV